MRNKMNVISRLVVTILVISASAFSKESGAVNQKSVAKVSEGVNQNQSISVMNINNHAFGLQKMVPIQRVVVIMVCRVITLIYWWVDIRRWYAGGAQR